MKRNERKWILKPIIYALGNIGSIKAVDDLIKLISKNDKEDINSDLLNAISKISSLCPNNKKIEIITSLHKRHDNIKNKRLKNIVFETIEEIKEELGRRFLKEPKSFSYN